METNDPIHEVEPGGYSVMAQQASEELPHETPPINISEQTGRPEEPRENFDPLSLPATVDGDSKPSGGIHSENESTTTTYSISQKIPDEVPTNQPQTSPLVATNEMITQDAIPPIAPIHGDVGMEVDSAVGAASRTRKV